MPSWDPDLYARYESYRDRPALELLLRLPEDLDPREVWDLGCGLGEHAALLARRFAKARVHGLDSSVDMLERARRKDAAVDWVLGDIADFAPDEAPDLIFSNAALHWLPDHGALFPRLAAMLAPGGVLMCQMPIQYETRHHAVIRTVAAKGPWASALAAVEGARPSAGHDAYYRWLAPHCREADIWQSTYLHVLKGDDPVVEWVSGTALRPYLDALVDPGLRAEFTAAMSEAMAAEFPPEADGETLLPFPRLFIVARR